MKNENPLQHYRLSKEPFHISPAPGFFYKGENHREALGMMLYSVHERLGLAALIGDTGTGKTTVLRAYLEQARCPDVQSILLFNPNVTFEGLLAHILRALGSDAPENDESQMLRAVADALVRERKQGRTVALVIDEAHHLPLETFRKMRLISDMETNREPLLQILFLARPEIEDLLSDVHLRHIRQQIAVRYYLRPLSPWESCEYIRHRIECAGGQPDFVFAKGAIKTICKASGGIPRMLNIFAANALLAGFDLDARPVTPDIVQKVLRDFAPCRHPRLWHWGNAAATILMSETAVLTAAANSMHAPSR